MPDIASPEKADKCRRDTSGSGKFSPERICGHGIWRDLGSFKHANRRRQNVIQRTHQISGRDGRLSRKSCDLAQGVDSGVGASRTLRQDFFAGDSSNGRGQRALDGGRLGLDLPPREVRAVIGQDQFEIAHGDCLESYRRRPSSNCLANLYKALPGAGGCGCKIPGLARQLYYGIHFAPRDEKQGQRR